MLIVVSKSTLIGLSGHHPDRWRTGNLWKHFATPSILCDRNLAKAPVCHCSGVFCSLIKSCISEIAFQIQFHFADGLFRGWEWNPDPSKPNGNLPLQDPISVTCNSMWNVSKVRPKWMWHTDYGHRQARTCPAPSSMSKTHYPSVGIIYIAYWKVKVFKLLPCIIQYCHQIR